MSKEAILRTFTFTYNMKYLPYTILFISMIACSPQCESLVGQWQVVSPFYKASFQIVNSEGTLKCAVLTYDDGTTKYDNRDKKPYFLAHDLRCKNGIYVNAVSGATPIVDKGLKLEVKDAETLMVTSYIMNKPLTEKWIKYGNENE